MSLVKNFLTFVKIWILLLSVFYITYVAFM